MKEFERLAFGIVVTLSVACGGGEKETQPAQDKVAVEPMPETGYRIQWGLPGVPCTLKAGAQLPVSVVVTNIGDQVWLDLPTSDQGRGAVRLAHRWWKTTELNVPVVDFDLRRGDLTAPLAPGTSTTLTVLVTAPPTPGSYYLQLDLVAELIAWFNDQNAAKLLVPVTVT